MCTQFIISSPTSFYLRNLSTPAWKYHSIYKSVDVFILSYILPLQYIHSFFAFFSILWMINSISLIHIHMYVYTYETIHFIFHIFAFLYQFTHSFPFPVLILLTYICIYLYIYIQIYILCIFSIDTIRYQTVGRIRDIGSTGPHRQDLMSPDTGKTN